MGLRLAFVAEGDAETRDCWSGCAQGFVGGLRRHGAEVVTFNAEPKGWDRWALAGRTISVDRGRWRNSFRFGSAGFEARSRTAARALERSGQDFDAIIQAGATFSMPAERRSAPYVIYADANIAFAAAGAPYSGISTLSSQEIALIAERERVVYETADRIWTWSDALKRSFLTDFGLPEAKLRTIYAGANTIPSQPSERRLLAPPRVLFVGRDMRRKGVDLVLDAFKRVRPRIPDAELHLVGGTPPGADVPGVVVHGFIPASSDEGRARISGLYASATVFCMPSRYEPYGAVFIEAMLAGLPCIGTASWAMPEIIQADETGWLIADGNTAELEQALLEALSDRARAAEMGLEARSRALELFTWEKVAERAISDVEKLLE